MDMYDRTLTRAQVRALREQEEALRKQEEALIDKIRNEILDSDYNPYCHKTTKKYLLPIIAKYFPDYSWRLETTEWATKRIIFEKWNDEEKNIDYSVIDLF